MTAWFGRDRVQWLAVAAIVAACNGVAASVFASVGQNGLVGALLVTFSVNPIFWFALLVPAIIAFEDSGDAPLQRGDRAVVALVLASAMFPVVTAGSAGVLFAACWLFATSGRGTRGQRAALMLFALTTTLVWGHLVLIAIGDTLVALDGRFVAWLAGTDAQGNLVAFSDGGNRVTIAYGCSSMHNVTMALQFWAAVTLLLRIPLGWRSALVGALAVIANVLVNGSRLAVLARNREQFEYWHTGGGGTLFAWIAVATVAIVVFAGTHAIAPRRA